MSCNNYPEDCEETPGAMQTKNRISGRNASRALASSKASRPQKKISEKVQGPEKKATELITSSVRKQKLGMLLIFSP